MIPDLAPIPVSGARLREAFDLAWQVLKPSDELLWREREANLAKAAADATRSLSERAKCREALSRDRASNLRAAAFEAREAAKPGFIAVLWSGTLRARQFIDGREFEIISSAWLHLQFDAATRIVPPIYIDRIELEAWLQAAQPRADLRPDFRALVGYLLNRMPPAPARVPTESEDLAAARARFGDTVSRDLIRDARREAYGDRMPKPGRSMA